MLSRYLFQQSNSRQGKARQSIIWRPPASSSTSISSRSTIPTGRAGSSSQKKKRRTNPPTSPTQSLCLLITVPRPNTSFQPPTAPLLLNAGHFQRDRAPLSCEARCGVTRHGPRAGICALVPASGSSLRSDQIREHGGGRDHQCWWCMNGGIQMVQEERRAMSICVCRCVETPYTCCSCSANCQRHANCDCHPPAEVLSYLPPLPPRKSPPTIPCQTCHTYHTIPSRFCTVYVHLPLSAPLLPAPRDHDCLFEKDITIPYRQLGKHHVLSYHFCHGYYYAVTTLMTGIFIISIPSSSNGFSLFISRRDPFSRSPGDTMSWQCMATAVLFFRGRTPLALCLLALLRWRSAAHLDCLILHDGAPVPAL